MIDVRYQRGLELPAHDLWLDPWDARAFAFVSHAHSDHIAGHEEVITSAGTARLMQERLGGTRHEHVLEFGERREFRDFAITLLPAGHIFGSAQSFIESAAGTLLYTGDFKLRSGLSAERTEWRPAETLIMETTYGLPRYCMPPTEQVIAEMVSFCREALEEDAVPVLLGYSLGKAQEILCALVAAGLTPMLHGSVFRMTEIYRALRPEFPCGYERYSAGDVAGKVLICPPSANRSVMITRIKNRRTAVLTGWALDPGAVFRYQCDAAFPLTDHADYPDLLRYVELVQPKRVLTLHGFAAAFARDLRDRGVEAWALSEENQLELSLLGAQRTSVAAPRPTAGEPPEQSASEFHQFALLGQQIAGTTSKLKKIQRLSEYLRALDSVQLPLAARYLTGRAFGQSD
ncbi:MAG TPA: DNA ligase, partial [Chthoniobacteraceae bacterium]